MKWVTDTGAGHPSVRVNFSARDCGVCTSAAARRAGLGALHPHMLRHSCGFYLANQGYDVRLIQDYFVHRDPKHTVHHTRVAGVGFEGMWET